MTNNQKIARLRKLYNFDEILEILGWYDYSNPDLKELEGMDEDSVEFEKRINEIAIDNGNFEEAIETGKRLEL